MRRQRITESEVPFPHKLLSLLFIRLHCVAFTLCFLGGYLFGIALGSFAIVAIETAVLFEILYCCVPAQQRLALLVSRAV